MTGVPPVDEAVGTPTEIPADASQFVGEGPEVPELGTVQMAYLHSYEGHVSHSWHTSMMNLLAYDKSIGQNLIRSMPFAVACSGPNSLPEGRNLAVQHFLDQTEHDWLFFVDTDMGFKPDALERLVFAADADTRPVVGGLCFSMKQMGADGYGGYIVRPMPTLFSWAKHPEQGVGFANRLRYPPETMVHVAGTGAAFLLIHRSVLTEIRKGFGDAWFNLRNYDDGTSVSEDLSFCWRVAQIGQRVFVHTGVPITHHKSVWLGEDAYVMPDIEPMAGVMLAAKDAGLNHEGSDRWTGGDRKDEK